MKEVQNWLIQNYAQIFRDMAWHTGFYQFQMPLEYYISDFLIFCSSYIGKSGERKKNDFPRCPFEIPPNQHSQFGPPGLDWLCYLAGNSKGHRGKSIFFLSPVLPIRVDQNIKKLEM